MNQEESNEVIRTLGEVSGEQIIMKNSFIAYKFLLTYAKEEDAEYDELHFLASSTHAIRAGTSLNQPAIAKLIIPIGAIVNLCQDGSRSFRSDTAQCYSVRRISDGAHVKGGVPKFDPTLLYMSARGHGVPKKGCRMAQIYDEQYDRCSVFPQHPFDTSTDASASGIHWFLERSLAVPY